MGLPRLARIAVVAVLLAAVASGCTSTPTAEVPDATTAPTPSASAESPPAPAPLLDVECERLLPAGLGSGLLAEQLPELAAAPVPNPDVGLTRPHDLAYQQAGGTSCRADNGEPMLVDGGLNPAWVAITALLLPGSAEQFAEFAEFSWPGEGRTEVTSCVQGPPNYCSLDVLVEDTWASMQFRGVGPALSRDISAPLPPQIAEISAGLSRVIAGATASGDRWTPPTDATALAPDCAAFFGPERIQADLGVTDTVYLDPYEDYPTAERASRTLATGTSCAWHDDSLRAFGAHSTLAGGEWAFRQLEEAGAFADHAPVQLTGLGPDDVAIMSCPAGADRCTAELVVGRNWVQLSVSLEVNGLDEQTGTARTTALAQAVVDSVLR